MDRERPPAPPVEWLPPPPGGLGIPPTPAPPPVPRSTVRIAVVLAGLFVIGALGGFAVAVVVDRGGEEPSPCEGKAFVSSAFAYCLDTPSGWESSPADQEPSGVDAHRAGLDDTVVYVEAVRLADGLDLQGFADSMRVGDTMKGYAVTDPEPGTLGGVPSLEWDAVQAVAGDEIVVREIVAVRGDIAWRLQITDTGSTGAPRLYEVRQMLDTWRFA